MPDPDELSFWERRRRDPRTGNLVGEPLSQRLPIYGKLFLIGLAVDLAVAAAVFLLSSARLEHAVGYTLILGGTMLLLTAGARGGGYSNLSLGAVEALVGGRNRTDSEDVEDEEVRRGSVMKRRDPMARLRRGLRPPPNPTAFWQAIAGFLYIAIGLPFTL